MVTHVKAKHTEGFGERMRYIRRRANLNQEDLANKLNLSRQSINAYENERAMPSFKALNSFCDQLTVNPWWLLYGMGDPSANPEEEGYHEGALYQAGPGESLTQTQRALIEYIKADRSTAQSLAKLLWDRALRYEEMESES
jgi:transcriptional regulator with XRE-family HTH domain